MASFEPIYDCDITKEILKTEKYLIHLTSEKNIEKIKKIGLVPKSKNNIFNYPEKSIS